MLVKLLPGASKDNVYQSLRTLQAKFTELQNVRGYNPIQYVEKYLYWVNSAAQTLRIEISAADVDRLVLTKRYEQILSMHAQQYQPAIGDLVWTELGEREFAFKDAADALGQEIARWSRPGVYIGMDTSVYIKHPTKLEEMDIAELIDVHNDDIHILVPMVVVEELDGLKLRGDRDVRWRAAYTLAVLERLLPQPTAPALLRAANSSLSSSGGIPQRNISIELLLDTPVHRRLPVNDDEIIDRLLSLRNLVYNYVVIFLTYDTSQAFKARAAGLRTIRLTMPIENDPEPDPQDKAGRKRRDRVHGGTAGNNGDAEHHAPHNADQQHSG